MADPVRVKVIYDTEEADAQLKAFQEKVTASWDKAGESAQGALKGIEDSSKRAADATEELLKMEHVEEAVGAVGDLKDIFEKTGVALLGLSEETVDMGVLMGDLAEKGASLGKIFGPLGAVIGGLTGAVLGYFTATADAADATEDLKKAEEELAAQQALNKKILEETTELTDKFTALREKNRLALTGDEFGLIGKSTEDLTDIYLEAMASIKLYDEAAASSQQTLKELSEDQVANADAIARQNENLENYAKWSDEASRKKDAAQAALDVITDSAKEASDAVADLTDALHLLNEEALGQLSRDSIEAEAELDGLVALLDTVTSSADVNVGESLIGQLARDAEDLADAILEIPPLSSILGDAEGLTSEDIILGTLESTLGLTRELSSEVQALGQQFAASMGGLAADSVDALFERIATGQKGAKGMLAAFLRETGTQLVADGTKNILIGAARTFFGDPTGAALAGLGAVEVGAGLGMGGVGAFAQRGSGSAQQEAPASGFSSTGNPSLGANDRSSSGSGGNISVVLSGNMFLEGDERSLAKAGHKLGRSISASRRDIQLDTGV